MAPGVPSIFWTLALASTLTPCFFRIMVSRWAISRSMKGRMWSAASSTVTSQPRQR